MDAKRTTPVATDYVVDAETGLGSDELCSADLLRSVLNNVGAEQSAHQMVNAVTAAQTDRPSVYRGMLGVGIGERTVRGISYAREL